MDGQTDSFSAIYSRSWTLNMKHAWCKETSRLYLDSQLLFNLMRQLQLLHMCDHRCIFMTYNASYSLACILLLMLPANSYVYHKIAKTIKG